MQRSDFIAKVLPIGLLDDAAGGGGAPKSPEPCHTPNVGSGNMSDRVTTDETSDRIDDLQAELLEARLDVLRIRAVLQGLAAALPLRAQAG